MLTEELESENSEPPEAKLASLTEVMLEPTRSIHLVIIDAVIFSFGYRPLFELTCKKRKTEKGYE